MNLLVVIVTYNGLKWIKRCIDSILDSSTEADIYIIDNGSTDGTIEYIQTNYSNVILKISQENLGFGKANNLGLQYAIDKGYEYIYLLNQDAWVEKDTFATLINLNKRYPEFGIISPIQINASGILDINFSYCCPKEILSDFFQGKLKEIYEVPEVMATHWMISRPCLTTVGGFSPAFPHYGEDNNFIQRAKYHGFNTGIATKTKAVHDRENRPITRPQTIYRQYITAITDYSNPLMSQSLVRIILWHFVKNAFTLKSFSPFRYMCKFIIKSRTLSRIKSQSRNTGAFLLNNL